MKKLIKIGSALACLSLVTPTIANATMRQTPIYNNTGKTNRMLITQTTGVKHTSPTPRPSLPTGKGLGSSGSVAKRINSIMNKNNGNDSIILSKGARN